MLGPRTTWRAWALAGVVALLGFADVGSARAERLRFGLVYDCSYTTHKRFGAPDVILRRSGRYQTAPRHRGKRLAGRVRWGRYRLRGGRIRFLTGPLEPPPGIAASYYDPPHNRLQIFQLKPAAVPWDCLRPGQPVIV